jgi:glycosyltransferase involved in cell wall biosynthesis
VDPQKYHPSDGSRSVSNFGIRTPFVLFVGRLSRQKGVFDLLEAMHHVPEYATLVLVTGKPDTPGIEEDLRRALSGMGHVVWIPEMLQDPDLVGLYNEAAVFVCPSIYEPFGIINLEAMACETPVVATRVGGIKEVVVDKETGFLVPPGDPVRLGRAITRLLEDPPLAARMGKKGRQRVLEQFTWDRIAAKTLELYRSLA